MTKKIAALAITDKIITNKIFLIRGQKVMLDNDLAALYGVETKRLKEQVRRNIARFPEQYMFVLTKEETESSRSQFATLNRGENTKYLPYAFTEHGVLMLSNVLKSKRAIQVSMRIIDVFVHMRESALSQAEIKLEIGRIREKLNSHG